MTCSSFYYFIKNIFIVFILWKCYLSDKTGETCLASLSGNDVEGSPVHAGGLIGFLNDPRSPSDNVTRTPLQLEDSVHHLHDPRSPSENVQRTPIVTRKKSIVNVIFQKSFSIFSSNKFIFSFSDDLLFLKRKGNYVKMLRMKSDADATNENEESFEAYTPNLESEVSVNRNEESYSEVFEGLFAILCCLRMIST